MTPIRSYVICLDSTSFQQCGDDTAHWVQGLSPTLGRARKAVLGLKGKFPGIYHEFPIWLLYKNFRTIDLITQNCRTVDQAASQAASMVLVIAARLPANLASGMRNRRVSPALLAVLCDVDHVDIR